MRCSWWPINRLEWAIFLALILSMSPVSFMRCWGFRYDNVVCSGIFTGSPCIHSAPRFVRQQISGFRIQKWADHCRFCKSVTAIGTVNNIHFRQCGQCYRLLHAGSDRPVGTRHVHHNHSRRPRVCAWIRSQTNDNSGSLSFQNYSFDSLILLISWTCATIMMLVICFFKGIGKDDPRSAATSGESKSIHQLVM